MFKHSVISFLKWINLFPQMKKNKLQYGTSAQLSDSSEVYDITKLSVWLLLKSFELMVIQTSGLYCLDNNVHDTFHFKRMSSKDFLVNYAVIFD